MIISADKNKYSPPEMNVIKDLKVDIPIVLVTRLDDFVFNDELLKLDKYILCCMSEYGWEWDLNKSRTHIWGLNTQNFPQFNTDEWRRFDDWVAANAPVLMLKRELLKSDVSSTVKPIDYPSYFATQLIQSKEEFNARPVSAFLYFGRSNEDRIILHSDIWKRATEYGYNVCDNPFWFNQFMEHEQGKKYVSIHIPHYARLELRDYILPLCGLSKISIVPFGAGLKTFRHSEITINSVMLTWEENLEWAFPWVSDFNCIKCRPGYEVLTIEKYINEKPDELYEIYRQGIITNQSYCFPNYTNHLEKVIQSVL